MPLAAPVTIATRPAIERERVGTGIVMGRPPYYTPSPQRKLAPLTVYALSGKGDSGPCSRGGGEACLPERRFFERAGFPPVLFRALIVERLAGAAASRRLRADRSLLAAVRLSAQLEFAGERVVAAPGGIGR